MPSETHVFIIWQNGRYREKEIITEISEKFELLQIFEISWPQKQFHYNLARFYGKSLPKGCKKEKECGCGDFLVVMAADDSPRYVGGKNQNTVEIKARWRKEFGKNYIHCSDTKAEGTENLQFLTGMSVEQIRQNYGAYDGSYIRLAPQMPCQSAWEHGLDSLVAWFCGWLLPKK